MKMRAGSLYKNWLVLYAENVTPICIRINAEPTQWEIYCNDVEVELETDKVAKVVFKNWELHVPYIQTDAPMKAIGFS